MRRSGALLWIGPLRPSAVDPRRGERGIALVIVLLVLTLLTIATLQFAYSTQVYSHLARNSVNGLQASLLARSGLNLGEAVLLYDNDPAVDSFLEEWCPEAGESWCRLDDSILQLPERMRLRVHIYDEGGKLNINLTRPTVSEYRQKQRGIGDDTKLLRYEVLQAALKSLLDAGGADPNVVDRLNEYWSQILQEVLGESGSTDSTEAAPGETPPPARPNQPANPTADSQAQAALNQRNFPSLDDANTVLGIDPTALKKLRRYITALPVLTQAGRINVNTAPREVLEAILEDSGSVDTIVFQRESAPLQGQDVSSLTQGVDPNRVAYVANLLGTRSDVFRVVASALVNADPMTGEGGLARTASIVVRRGQGQPRNNRANSEIPPWTLTRLDWQKEGGAVLFEEASPGVDQPSAPGDDDRASF